MTAAVTGHRRRMVRLVSIETAAKRSVFSSRRKVSRDSALRTDAVHKTKFLLCSWPSRRKVPDIITCAKFQNEILRGCDSTGGRNSQFLTDTERPLQQCSAIAMPVM